MYEYTTKRTTPVSDKNPHTDRIQKQFTRQAKAYADTAQARDIKSMNRVVELTKIDHSSTTLDVACGPGRLTMALAQCAADATGIDATAALLNIARSEANILGLENIEFIEGTALSLPFDSQSFDLVSCRAAFHHFEEPEKVLTEMARVTRVGGELLIADILGNSDMNKARHHDALETLCDPTHVRCLSAEIFRSIFAREGLEISREIKGETTYDVAGWIEHGGPNPETAAEIERIFEENTTEDRIGLEPRLENGVMMFTHQTVVYVLEKVTG